MNKKLLFLFLFGGSILSSAQNKMLTPVYKNANMPIAKRVSDLLSRMTLEEKAGQLNQITGGFFTGPALNDAGQQEKMKQVREGLVGSMLNVVGSDETRAIQKVAVENSRLGIPLLFGFDVIHGYKTIFPIPLAEACSWDLNQIEQNASVAASEASAAGINWTFAPMCDISNDPRWGRVMEGAGEDPWLAGEISAARVHGFQGNLNDTHHILACVKHFAGYGAVESGREYNYVDFSRVALWNKYLPSYKAAVSAGAVTVMNSFNLFEGRPTTASHYLVTDVLKKKWGFQGFLITDWQNIDEMVTHGFSPDRKQATLQAFRAGSMMDMESKAMVTYLPDLVRRGFIEQRELDAAVAKILEVKFRLGLFDHPFAFCDSTREKALIFTAENRKKAKDAAEKSIVLLKNERSVLPLDLTKSHLALFGFYAKSKEDLFDFWIAKGDSRDAVSVYEGLSAKTDYKLPFAEGYLSDGTTSDSLIAEALKVASQADVLLVNVGLSGKMAGEDRSLANPVIPAGQLRLLKALHKTGKPVIALISAGRPLILTQMLPFADAVLQCWILGTETGSAIADVLSGQYNPTGRTVMSFPYAVGQIPVYYNHFNTGRPLLKGVDSAWKSRYRDIPNDPLFPFGFGLSYTQFSYSDLLVPETKQRGKSLSVSIRLTNTGDREGTETVQLYLRQWVASIVQPVKKLKAFKQVHLKAGASEIVHFTLNDSDLIFYDSEGNEMLEPGKFSVFVGANSRDVQEGSFILK